MKPIQNIRRLKTSARALLENHHAVLAGITLLMAIANLALSSLALSAVPAQTGLPGMVIYYVGTLLVNVVYYLLLAGLHRIYLNLCRGLPFHLSDLIAAFTYRPEPIALYSVLQYLLTLLFSAVLRRYGSIAFAFIWYARTDGLLPGTLLLSAALVILIGLQLSLAMVLFLYWDEEEVGTLSLIRKSHRLMAGLRKQYLYLLLSFLGLDLLGILSLGIGFLFVQPYAYSTKALFYESYKDRAHRPDADEDDE